MAHDAPTLERVGPVDAVAVHQFVRALDGSVLADREVTHVYSFRDGLIVRMDVSDSPA
jgi:hypothetical protein